MPITFIDIERQKSSRIGLLVIFLSFMYFLLILSLYLGISFLLFPLAAAGRITPGISLVHLVVLFICSVTIAFIHFWFSSSNVVSSITKSLGALPPDPEDSVHRRLMNVTDEIMAASGNIRKIRCLVIPSLSMNALAAEGLKGEAVIAITEGLLSRLSRDQMEAVIAHEAYHVLSGDCRAATLVTSLFGMYASLLDGMQSFSEENRRGGLPPTFFPFWILLKLSNLLGMFISREREYRADAAAVRMTRNPMAMAEALYFISKNWTGGGALVSGIEMLCIVNPAEDSLDESEGWLPDLMSTHPPIGRRIGLLLTMAHSNLGLLVRRMSEEKKTVRFGEFSPEAGSISRYKCPVCAEPLLTVEYEETQIQLCSNCHGKLVSNDRIPRIIARRGQECTGRIEALARAVIHDNQRQVTTRNLKNGLQRSKAGCGCPKCGNVMFRTFYSGAYLVEIDRCGLCGITWFDADELEMLQCLIENRITGRIGIDGL